MISATPTRTIIKERCMMSAKDLLLCQKWEKTNLVYKILRFLTNLKRLVAFPKEFFFLDGEEKDVSN